MLIIGGYFNSLGEYNGELYSYNLASKVTQIVSVKGSKPESRTNFSVVTHRHELFVFGGFNEINMNDLWALNLLTL